MQTGANGFRASLKEKKKSLNAEDITLFQKGLKKIYKKIQQLKRKAVSLLQFHYNFEVGHDDFTIVEEFLKWFILMSY